jgi:glycosyltransferase involved in cell wall biosynthesis
LVKVLEVYQAFLPKHGGVEVYMLDLCKALRKTGDTPVVLAYDPSKPVCEVMDGIIVQRFHMPDLFIKYRYPQIVYLFIQIFLNTIKHNIKIIHAQDYLPGLAAALAGKILRIPVVVTFHLPINKTSWRTRRKTSPSYPIERILQNIYIKNVRLTLCVCKFTLNKTIELGFPENKLKVIYNWVMRPNNSNGKEENEVLHKYQISKPYALAVGRLDEKQKAFSLLIKAFKILSDKSVDLNLAIIGQGPDEKMYQHLIQKLGLQSRIHLLIRVPDEDLKILYKNCTLFVLSSFFEALPLVLLEAISYGKPVIATNTGGVNEIVEDGINGLLVETTPESIAKGVEQIVSFPEKQKSFAEAAKKTATVKFSESNRDEVMVIIKMMAEGKLAAAEHL